MKLFKNIGQLVQVRENSQQILRGALMSDLPALENAWLLVDRGLIQDYGSMGNLPSGDFEEIDVKGAMLMPSFVDSHTHLVYAADRHEEFVMKIKGMDYQAIAEVGGGILNSARKRQNTT